MGQSKAVEVGPAGPDEMRHHSKGERTVPNVLRDRVMRHPAAVFLRTEQHDVTLSEADRETNRIAKGLTALGVGKGENVLVMLPNCLEIIYLWIGLSKIGAVEVTVNTDYMGHVLRHVIDTSGASRMVIHRDYLGQLAAVVRDTTSLRTVLVYPDVPASVPNLRAVEVRPFKDIVSDSDADPGVTVSYRDLVAVMFTSGTTGPSKGVMITHAQAYEYAYSLIGLLDLQPGDVYYAPLPLFHIAGQWAVVYASLIGGAVAVVPPKFSVTAFWDDVRRYDATASFLLGAMANLLYRQPALSTDREHSLDRVLVVPLPFELEEFRHRFGIRVSTCYASSEANVPIIADFSVSHPLTCGKARPGYQLALVDENDERVPPRTVGELVVRPDEPWMTMRGYTNMPDATAEAYRNAWLHTGDAFYQDEDGNFYFVDRLKDAIRRRGENISSYEVEREVNAYAPVLESAAVAVPSEYGEDEVMVVVAPKPNAELDPERLFAFLTSRLPRFMLPRYIKVIPNMPKTPTGKIQKYQLRSEGIADAWERNRPSYGDHKG